MKWEKASDIHNELTSLVKELELTYIDATRLICFRSYGSVARARARIWSLPTVWQLALEIKPHYVIEVISEKFDRLSPHDKKRVLIHELMHIPKTFSGALSPHRSRHRPINGRTVEKLFRRLFK